MSQPCGLVQVLWQGPELQVLVCQENPRQDGRNACQFQWAIGEVSPALNRSRMISVSTAKARWRPIHRLTQRRWQTGHTDRDAKPCIPLSHLSGICALRWRIGIWQKWSPNFHEIGYATVILAVCLRCHQQQASEMLRMDPQPCDLQKWCFFFFLSQVRTNVVISLRQFALYQSWFWEVEGKRMRINCQKWCYYAYSGACYLRSSSPYPFVLPPRLIPQAQWPGIRKSYWQNLKENQWPGFAILAANT